MVRSVGVDEMEYLKMKVEVLEKQFTYLIERNRQLTEENRRHDEQISYLMNRSLSDEQNLWIRHITQNFLACVRSRDNCTKTNEPNTVGQKHWTWRTRHAYTLFALKMILQSKFLCNLSNLKKLDMSRTMSDQTILRFLKALFHTTVPEKSSASNLQVCTGLQAHASTCKRLYSTTKWLYSAGERLSAARER